MGREHRRHVPITCVGFSFKIWEVRVGVLANLIMWYILFASLIIERSFGCLLFFTFAVLGMRARGSLLQCAR